MEKTSRLSYIPFRKNLIKQGLTYLIEIGVPDSFQPASPARDDVVPVAPLTKTISFHDGGLDVLDGHQAFSRGKYPVLAEVGFAIA